MKTRTLLLVVSILIGVAGTARAELVAYWNLDEAVGATTAADTSGSANVHDATLFGSNPAFAPTAGKFGGALWLPGVDEFAQAADHTDFQFPAEESFTVTMWYKRDGVENDQGLITKGYHDTSRNVNYWMLQTRSNGFTYDSRKGTGGTPRVRLDAGGNHGDNQWHHFAVVRDSVADELRLYVDNDPTPLIHNMGAGDGNGDWDVGVHSDPLVIGNHYNRYTQGHFDDIGIWKGEALTAAEIDAIYHFGIPSLASTVTPAVMHLPFDETGGTLATDATGFGNDGTLVGGATFVPGGGKFGGAVSLDGSSGFVEVVDNALLEFPAGVSYSLSLWYNNDFDENTNEGLITKGYHDTSRAENYYLMQVTGADVAEFDSRPTTGGTPRERLLGTTDITDGEWHHIVFVRDSLNDELRLYVDTTLENSSTTADYTLGVNDDPLVIGNHFNRFTEGLFDEVYVFRGALQESEIQSLFQSNSIGGVVIPEPSTFVLAALGVLGLALAGRRRRRRAA